jgi:2,4-dienoyl-CoA reductase-like NADH-dependent reductase (Old Yellow Enzyme family)
MNATDGFPPNSSMAGLGLDVPESIEVATLLEKAGVCAIEVSGGIGEAGGVTIRTAINSPSKEAYFKNYSKMIKAAVHIPVILVGGIRSIYVMSCLLENGCADLISMSRVFISEPDFIPKIKSDRTKKARCVSCNLCFDPKGIRCNFEFD